MKAHVMSTSKFSTKPASVTSCRLHLSSLYPCLHAGNNKPSFVRYEQSHGSQLPSVGDSRERPPSHSPPRIRRKSTGAVCDMTKYTLCGRREIFKHLAFRLLSLLNKESMRKPSKPLRDVKAVGVCNHQVSNIG
jgi:hypothetical protein